MRKVCSLFLALIIAMVSTVPVLAGKDVAIAKGVLTSGTSWTLWDDGTLRISGNGDMPETLYGAPWFNYDVSPTTIIVDEGVTSISAGAFQRMFTEDDSIVSVELPATLRKIGDDAFACCIALRHVRFTEGGGITSIGKGAFSVCSALTQLDLPETVNYIGNGAFSMCTSLSSINLPSGVKVISRGAFERCESLRTFVVSSSVERIECRAFVGCVSLKEVELPASLRYIGQNAFLNCDKLSVHFLGTERQWSGIEIDNDFDQISNCYYSNAILNATISFVGEPVIVVDEPSSWAIDALGKAAQKGIPSDRRVGYKCNCPRIEFAHYVADMFRAVTGESLAQLAKEQGMGLSASYKDTSDVDVLALTALGIFRGGGNNMFFPERTLTRGESATVLTRAARVLGVDVDSAPKNCFPDVDCSWIELDWLAFTGIAKGTDKGLFEPGRTLVAQEALLFVSRLYNVVDPAGDLSAGFLLYCHISYAKMD